MLSEPVSKLKGIGKVRAGLFEKLGVYTVGDLIRLYPRAYTDYSVPHKISDNTEEAAAYPLTIMSQPTIAFFHGISLVSCKATDGSDLVTLKWFNMPYQKGRLHAGDTVIACGKIDRKKGNTLPNPALYAELPGIIPVYNAVKGLKQAYIRSSVKTALENAVGETREVLPGGIVEKYGLISGADALFDIHFPQTKACLEKSKYRISFENILEYLVAVSELKQELNRSNGIAFSTAGTREAFLKMLPFSLTNAQLRVCGDIERDMAAPRPMNRLIQGDVGSGKTILAVYAMFTAMQNGYQSALLAPTEILAEQHYSDIVKMFPGTTVLLKGSMPAGERRATLEAISEGKASIVIGTHALLGENVLFRKLGLTITDEQHRFGVSQRAHIERKGARPDVLVMSATPIPRTLSMLMYGDLDVSNVDELPPGRLPVKTRYIARSKRKQMYDYIVSEADNGNSSYIVCPYIDPPEEGDGTSVNGLYAELKKVYPKAPVAMLHGGLKREEKEDVMTRFRSGSVRILISTTVIEVGVHVADANIIAIEDADRFGLAQLHQLRGRVGRGNRQAYCFLLTGSDSDSARERISAMVETSDGFKIAEKDLEMRGPGDFFGTRQHGSAEVEEIFSGMDLNFLNRVKEAAAEIMDIPNNENNEFLEYACKRYAALNEIAMN